MKQLYKNKYIPANYFIIGLETELQNSKLA
jgi:hypothetical protein